MTFEKVTNSESKNIFFFNLSKLGLFECYMESGFYLMTMHKNRPAVPLAGLKIVVEHLIAGLANRSLTNFCKKIFG
jgi:hypothetical protein